MKQEEDKFTGLPENAFRELKSRRSVQSPDESFQKLSGSKLLVSNMGVSPWPSFSRQPPPIWG